MIAYTGVEPAEWYAVVERQYKSAVRLRTLITVLICALVVFCCACALLAYFQFLKLSRIL